VKPAINQPVMKMIKNPDTKIDTQKVRILPKIIIQLYTKCFSTASDLAENNAACAQKTF
jgi:hypothetical protein